MTSPVGKTSLINYYIDSPKVLIRDFRGNIYSFPSAYYDNPADIARETDVGNWYNGRKWKNYPWFDSFGITNDFVTHNGLNPSNIENDNCFNETRISVLNSQGPIPGYIKKSGGFYKSTTDPTRDFIIADRGIGKNNWAFSLYLKKDLDEFRKDMLNANKEVFQILVSLDCSRGNQRYVNACPSFCSDPNYNSNITVRNNCSAGNNQWCRDTNTTSLGSLDKTVDSSVDPKCLAPFKEGVFDNDFITPRCETNDRIASVFCTDVRKNAGSVNEKLILNRHLFNKYCNTDLKITSPECADVRNICNDTNQLSTDIAPYNCNSLVKGLDNDNNIIMMTTKLDLNNTTVNRDLLLNSFNNSITDAVEDALCSIAINTTVPECKLFNEIRSTERKLNTFKDDLKNRLNVSLYPNGELSTELINFIESDFIKLQNYRGVDKYPNSHILTPELFTYCETNDPFLQRQICKTIYSNPYYKKDAKFIESLDRFTTFDNCVNNNAFMGKSTSGINDPLNSICSEQKNSIYSLAKFLPHSVKYCKTSDNIVSNECKSYYDNILTNLNNFISFNYTNAKSTFINNDETNDETNDSDNDHYKNNYMILLLIIIFIIVSLLYIKKYTNYRKIISKKI